MFNLGQISTAFLVNLSLNWFKEIFFQFNTHLNGLQN